MKRGKAKFFEFFYNFTRFGQMYGQNPDSFMNFSEKVFLFFRFCCIIGLIQH